MNIQVTNKRCCATCDYCAEKVSGERYCTSTPLSEITNMYAFRHTVIPDDLVETYYCRKYCNDYFHKVSKPLMENRNAPTTEMGNATIPGGGDIDAR